MYEVDEIKELGGRHLVKISFELDLSKISADELNHDEIAKSIRVQPIDDMDYLRKILFKVLERKKDETSVNSWQAVTEISKELRELEKLTTYGVRTKFGGNSVANNMFC